MQNTFNSDNKILDDFYNGIIDSNLDLTNFYNNVNSLKIFPVSINEMADKHSLAEYSFNTNEIVYQENEYKYSIMHELLHMLSTKSDEDNYYTGFCVVSKNNNQCFGIGLNEAYTCILDDRYFGNYVEDKTEYMSESYKICRVIVSYLDDLLGEDLMEKAYSTSNTDIVIKALSTLMDRNDVITFIGAIDSIYYYCDNTDRPNFIYSTSNFYYCIYFLTLAFIESITKKYVNKEISGEEYNEGLEAIKSLSLRQIKIGRLRIIRSKKMSDKEFSYYVSEIYENNLKEKNKIK